MSAAVTIACLIALQQLAVEPAAVSVGDVVIVTVRRAGAPAPAIEVSVEEPDGRRSAVGVTDGGGRVRYVPAGAGQHALMATVDAVRCVSFVAVAPGRNRWLLLLASVPLGAALLWLNIRSWRAGRPAARADRD